MAERCVDCGLPLPPAEIVEHAEAQGGGCECERCVAVCWRAWYHDECPFPAGKPTFLDAEQLEERIATLERELQREREAVDACHEYWKQCALAWHRNEGRVGEATTGGAVVVGDNLDVLADRASALVIRCVESRLSAERPANG